MNTYPKDFKNQVYIVAYGILGNSNHIDSEVYDAHEAFEIDKTKMKMLVPLDMNKNRLMNVPNVSYNFIYGMVDAYAYFSVSSIRLEFENVFLVSIKLTISGKYKSKQTALIVDAGGVHLQRFLLILSNHIIKCLMY